MDVLATITEEARNHRTVIINYQKKDGSLSGREIEPIEAKTTGKGNTLLYAFCRSSQGVRSFDVANILEAHPTGNTFEPNPQYPVKL